MNKVELLSPAGDMNRLKIALLYGADAVYIGGTKYSLRANARNFTIAEIKDAAEYTHKLGKKIYVTVNIAFHNEDIEGLLEYLLELEKCKIDAIISSDLLIIKIIKEHNIKLPVHISTQASVTNYETANLFKDLGASRVVLSRECSRNEIKEIIDKTNIEIETFIHGAMCASYSGRCVLSNYFTMRDANRGGCAQVCRFCFKLKENGKYIDTNVPYTLASKDLSLIRYIKDMIEIGISSFKIEGRMRSIYYIATVINTYRRAIDDYYNGQLDEKRIDYYEKILNRVANRDNYPQFYDKFPDKNCQYYIGREEVSNQDYLAIVDSYDGEYVTVIQKNYFKKGDKVEFISPSNDTYEYIIPDIYDTDMNKLDVARHPEQVIKFKINYKLNKYDMMRIKFLD